MNRSFDALLFDMDGLMLDTEQLSCAATRLAGQELDVEIEDAMLLGMVGLSEARCTVYIAEHFQNAELAERLQKSSRAHYRRMLEQESIPLKPGIIELLEWAKQQNIPRAVATSTRRAICDIKLANSGLARFFEHTVAGDEVVHAKPAPDLYLAAADKLGISAARCIALEDSPYGMQAALAAGARAIMVPDLIAPEPALRASALAVCDDLRSALALIQSL
ncbi:HAD family phosphatase [Chromobacterium sp. IIBBL 290-4]|uniref:HAD family hydrolase n=1 Tax=Chromobacterium sp. IIBBL 290-4 TaxID=2953890 RepID=UPI0020B7E18D|nr:HAD family phosphatase [Chromobacterium sp. IIBBL 290-4]UTH73412.1 HAD family phosphatase [Chromobacterium sp. IIBBL 290-4]